MACTAAQTLGSWVQIPFETWMYSHMLYVHDCVGRGTIPVAMRSKA
jgi:hypothetical protein